MVGDMATYVGPESARRDADRRRAALLLEQIRQQYAPASPEEVRRQFPELFMETGTAPKPEGVKVSTVDAQLKQKLQERRDEREVTARLALVDAYGEDVYPAGTVITFVKKFDRIKDVPYTYAAIKGAGDKWFSTGHDCVQGTTFTWDTLIEFLVTGPFPVKTFIVKAEGGVQVPPTAKATATVNQS